MRARTLSWNLRDQWDSEVDLIWQKGKRAVGIEIKLSRAWKSGFNRGLKILLESGKIQKGLGIYLGTDALKDSGILILPVMQFLKKLHAGEIFE